MSSSLLMVVQNTPVIEPLPAYRRDPETSSIRSSAPSYVSEAPTYHSTIPISQPQTQQRLGLPPANYAPGFHHVRSLDRNGLSHLNFSINQWSSVYSSPQARHYHNVAARRTQLARIEEQALISNLASQMVFPTFNLPAVSSNAATANTNGISTTGFIPGTNLMDDQYLDSWTSAHPPSTPSSSIITTTAETAPSTIPPTPLSISVSNTPSAIHSTTQTPLPTRSTTPIPTLLSSEPHSPLEDPDLVGHAAATVARERRLYIARETRARIQREEREAAAVKEENKRWDFLLGQMAEWEDRERCWKAFHRRMESRGRGGGSARRVLFRFWK